jgi:putative endonuclease
MENLYTVYVLESERDGSFYKGFTQDLAQRLKQHNAGKTKSTRAKIPWRVIYTEAFLKGAEA